MENTEGKITGYGAQNTVFDVISQVTCGAAKSNKQWIADIRFGNKKSAAGGTFHESQPYRSLFCLRITESLQNSKSVKIIPTLALPTSGHQVENFILLSAG